MRSRLFLGARIAFPFVIFAFLIAVVDVGSALQALGNASPWLVALAIALVQFQIMLAALRWWLTARSIGQPLGVRRAILEYYGASLLNMVLPGGVSGDVLRVARSRSDAGASGWERPAQSVVLERFSGQAAFALVAAAGLGFWVFTGKTRIPSAAIDSLLITLAIAALAAIALASLAWFARGRLKGLIGRFAEAARLVFLRPKQAVMQFALSLAVVALYVGVFALSSHAVGAPLSFEQTLLVVPPALLTMIVPISVGGWGAREAASAALWPIVGFAASEGVAAAVLYGLVSTAGALPGLLTFALPGEARPAGASSGESRA